MENYNEKDEELMEVEFDEFDEEEDDRYNPYDICREILDYYDIPQCDENWIGSVDIDRYLDANYPEMPEDDRWFVHDRMEKFVIVEEYNSVVDDDEDED